MTYDVRKHHYPNHADGPRDGITIYHMHESLDHGEHRFTPQHVELNLSIAEAYELAMTLLSMVGAAGGRDD